MLLFNLSRPFSASPLMPTEITSASTGPYATNHSLLLTPTLLLFSFLLFIPPIPTPPSTEGLSQP
ncbi:hypothetical protein CONPUDRAFT_154615 [Coniophora puteana RWD-64-598 SS2]|uniref:Uncharacterized protein n=1 Tax=Coniophora puteana (strain RWD-64-598) TaxID=741705 RepID=A0A5M3MN37_CONPW|nr:uncharacterized protein CONPUDRAFT_154615 [Coniophora puteana RWD-64-598 SS2]EIW80588.1 hypothetical protein CONPUDRAFT_154615 [Coniophora puteana RWD-64-598 SS2]